MLKSRGKNVKKGPKSADPNEDCYFYYYSSCSKGDSCEFRHEPAARQNEKMCLHWLKGSCTKAHCNFRHMKLNKNRGKIPCYHEGQSSGCQKDNCPFLHEFKDNLENDGHLPDVIENTRNFSKKARKVEEGLTSFQLAASLSEFPEFCATLYTLFERFEYSPTHVKQIVIDNCNVFELGEVVSLRPKISICDEYLQESGCQSVSRSSVACLDLHICRDYVLQKCNDDNCILGHSWLTKHNTDVLESFKLSRLSPNPLFRLFSGYIFISNKKKELKICEDYNKNSCINNNCVNLHICIKYLANLCTSEETCTLNHDVTSKDSDCVLQLHDISVNETPRDVFINVASCPLVSRYIKDLILEDSKQGTVTRPSDQVKPVIKTTWSHEYGGDTAKSEICYNSVENYCPYEESGCFRLHCEFYFYWQVKSSTKKDNFWVNLTKTQVLALEKAYCDPTIDKIILPQLNPATLDTSCRGLLLILNGKSKWEADFDSMQLKSMEQSEVLALRRLETEQTANPSPPSCVFLWYFQDKHNIWIEYGKVDSTKEENLIVDVTSTDIEKHYKQNPSTSLQFKNSSFGYTLDTVLMQQINTSTNVSRRVTRRPAPHMKEDQKKSTDLPDQWEVMQSGERVRRVDLLPTSDEYKKVAAFVQKQGGTFAIHKIERIQNPYAWRAFQNKVLELTSLYQSESAVNVQQIFHGTSAAIVANICEQNFDWRLHGSSTGQMYGRGTYFSPLAATAYQYAKPDASGQRVMFIAQVAIGSMTLGNSGMVRPPINPQTNQPFESTVNAIANPSIIVKYDKQEYVPEYILTIS